MKTALWLYPGKAGWTFLTLPAKESAIIKERFRGHARGWGSLPVSVTIGNTQWETSIFPDKKTHAFLLPVKAEVRKKEGVEIGKMITYTIEVRT